MVEILVRILPLLWDGKELNQDLKLTVDLNIQYLIREELMKFKNIFNSIGSAAILMNSKNGEILSLISLPDYDLNKRQLLEDKNLKRSAMDYYNHIY